MDARWSGFLQGSGRPGHAVQIYADVSELADSVASYFAAGFDLGEPAVAIATPEHLEVFLERLGEKGWNRERIELAGLLSVVDAATTLESLLVDGSPDEARFERVVGGTLDAVASRFPGKRIRAFGEMVDLLYQAGDRPAAARLEALWNRAATRRHFSLLCGYRLDVFDGEEQRSALPEICRSHSHVLPAQDPARLEQAVGAALEESLGPEAGKVYALAGRELARRAVPPAQLALMWVSSQMPRSAERILESARAKYLRPTG